MSYYKTGPARVVPAQAIYKFLEKAGPGQRLVYAVGHHLQDYSIAEAGIGAIRIAYNEGKIDLAQRRRDDSNFDYIAIRRHKIAKINSHFMFPRRMCA